MICAKFPKIKNIFTKSSIKFIVVVLALCSWIEISALAQTDFAHPYQRMAKEFLHELIEIDTTHSTGSTTVAAQAMADHLIAAGFP